MKKTIANLLPLIAAAAVMSAGARSPGSVPDFLALPGGGRAATAAQWEKDGTGIIRYTWTSDGVPLVFDIRVAVNKRRQMAVSTMLHIKGDNLNARLAP